MIKGSQPNTNRRIRPHCLRPSDEVRDRRFPVRSSAADAVSIVQYGSYAAKKLVKLVELYGHLLSSTHFGENAYAKATFGGRSFGNILTGIQHAYSSQSLSLDCIFTLVQPICLHFSNECGLPPAGMQCKIGIMHKK